MVLYEYVGKMLRKEGKIVVENVKKLMRKAMGIVLSVVLTLGCILGSGTIAWAEGETADAAAKIKVACVGDSLTEGTLRRARIQERKDQMHIRHVCRVYLEADMK